MRYQESIPFSPHARIRLHWQISATLLIEGRELKYYRSACDSQDDKINNGSAQLSATGLLFVLLSGLHTVLPRQLSRSTILDSLDIGSRPAGFCLLLRDLCLILL